MELVKKLACDSCEVKIYDLNAGCETNECREKVETYGIIRVPAGAVDSKLLECCQSGNITEESLRAAGIGKQ